MSRKTLIATRSMALKNLFFSSGGTALGFLVYPPLR